MNMLTRELKKLTDKAEKEAASKEKDKWYPLYHLAPPQGWLNDPNGLCQKEGVYHGFFQYSPLSPEGGLKFWGHSVSRDLFSWEYQGAALYPDQPFDCHGVYSGSAFVEDGKIRIYYTGNVKEDGDFDYIRKGRQGNLVMTETEDGKNFSAKKWLMKNEDYPSDCTCHVRDPKVWKQDGLYYMVQGARNEKEYGEVLLYKSQDGENWTLANRFKTEQKMGYMWECPDFFSLNGQRILSVSPQGMEHEEARFQNTYESGWFPFYGELEGSYLLGEFEEWDYGFDFYAPQTFLDEEGRRILIGWMGMPDTPEFVNPTVAYGWQHIMTVPRELTWENGRVFQFPVEEISARRGGKSKLKAGEATAVETAWDLEVHVFKNQDFAINLSEGLKLWRNSRLGIFAMEFTGPAGAGRTMRKVKLDQITDLRILGDASSIEIFINQGEKAMSTRYYPEEKREITITGGAEAVLYSLK
ncbi:glycoside hydrolase family 32 protein [Lachnoclostridium edouardi]|uniref:glycoside hydrolase family 32 protein n=1 Tax=Lachnoclostridium edouardi TaxID=1926283 RepID=UPI000C7DBC01|nr:glycoside hydrolase family 32 protein [Lachnoclostridium edouardi]